MSQKVKEEWVGAMTKLCRLVEGHLQVPLQKVLLSSMFQQVEGLPQMIWVESTMHTMHTTRNQWDIMLKLRGPVLDHLQVPLQKALLPMCTSRDEAVKLGTKAGSIGGFTPIKKRELSARCHKHGTNIIFSISCYPVHCQAQEEGKRQTGPLYTCECLLKIRGAAMWYIDAF